MMERRDSSGQSGPRWSFPETHLVPDGAHEPSKAQGPQRTIGGFSQPTAASADQRRLQPAASSLKAQGIHHRRLQPAIPGNPTRKGNTHWAASACQAKTQGSHNWAVSASQAKSTGTFRRTPRITKSAAPASLGEKNCGGSSQPMGRLRNTVG